MQRTRWMVVAAVGSALTAAAPGGSGTVAHAAKASTGKATMTSPWKAVSTVKVSPLDQPGVHTYGSTFEIAWVQPGTHTGDVLMTRRFNAKTGASMGGTHKVMPAWAALNNQVQLSSYRGQRMLIFAGIRETSKPTDPYENSSMYYLTSGDGKAWQLQPGSLSHVEGVTASEGLAAVNDAGTPVVAFALSPNGWITYHKGVSASIPATEPDGTSHHDTKCCVYDPGLARDSHGGWIWAAWYSNSPNNGWNGINAEAIPSGKRHVAPGSSVTYTGKPSSISPNQTVQLASRPKRNHGGVYTAYLIGYPSPTTIGVWQLATAKTAFRITGKDAVDKVGIAPATGGRLWIYWYDRTSRKVMVALTNTKVTKVASTFTLPSPGGQEPFNLVGDGTSGRLNLVAVGGTQTKIYHTVVKP